MEYYQPYSTKGHTQENSVYLKSKPTYPMATISKPEVHESNRGLQIFAEEKSIKESKRNLIIKTKENSKKASFKGPTPSFIKLLNKNYTEKLFHLNDVQSDLFRRVLKNDIIPVSHNNIKLEYLKKPDPIFRLPKTRNIQFTKKLVEESMEKPSLQLSEACVVKDNRLKDGFPRSKSSGWFLHQKKSVDNFKSNLAATSTSSFKTSPSKSKPAIAYEGTTFELTSARLEPSNRKPLYSFRSRITHSPAEQLMRSSSARYHFVKQNIKNQEAVLKGWHESRRALVPVPGALEDVEFDELQSILLNA